MDNGRNVCLWRNTRVETMGLWGWYRNSRDGNNEVVGDTAEMETMVVKGRCVNKGSCRTRGDCRGGDRHHKEGWIECNKCVWVKWHAKQTHLTYWLFLASAGAKQIQENLTDTS